MTVQLGNRQDERECERLTAALSRCEQENAALRQALAQPRGRQSPEPRPDRVRRIQTMLNDQHSRNP